MRKSFTQSLATGLIALVSACSGETHETAQTSPDETPSTSLPVPDPACDGCYIVNASVSGPSSSELYVVGYVGGDAWGFLRRFDGQRWTTVRESETLLDVRDIWAGGEAEIYVAGAGEVQRFSPETRQFESTGISGGSVWGTAANTVHVLDGAVVHHYDGSAWASRALPFSGVAITGTGDRVFVLGSNGVLAELENGSWVAREGQLDVGLKALCATSDRIYAVAGDDRAEGTGPGVIATYDGTSWARVQEAEEDALLAIACNSSGNVYAVGAVRGAGGTAHAVVWEHEGGDWVRHELADVEVFLWDATCVTGGCFAVGTNNTVLALEDL